MSRFKGVTIDGVWISEFDLLTTCAHNSELQVITALPQISTLWITKHWTLHSAINYFSTELVKKVKVKSKLLWWRFTANHSVLASRPLRITTRVFFSNWNLAVIVLM
jgi:hypothetical protein